ncbi:AraC family transcriptional regulator [Shewanella sp. 4t3-1-2LB]|uniref:AraC family ligand binding domain-containing protein n=1 Tax=Shewanella sp. 4t3-1-2LB TaxID=2817682 RepID=UPI001A996171|nr:AraC family transcriptional regulator [Shewanella sp. 4t3-1-2LB]
MFILSAPAIEHQLLTPVSGIELVRARYQGFAFDRHVHADFHIGVVDCGAQRFMHRGSQYLLAPGRISLINPDEVHDGEGLNKALYQVRLLRISGAAWAQFAQQLGYAAEPYFNGPEIVDQPLYRGLLQLHQLVNQPHGAPIAVDGLLLELMSALIKRHGDSQRRSVAIAGGLTAWQITLLKDFLYADLAANHRLQTLAQLFQLNEFQFLRRFRRSFGMTPHAYILALRVDYARQLLAAGNDVATAASAAGFYDQSHLHHYFKRRYNLTPALYRRQLAG